MIRALCRNKTIINLSCHGIISHLVKESNLIKRKTNLTKKFDLEKI